MADNDKTRLIAELKAAHAALRTTVDTVDLGMVVYPDTGWKAQDLLGHLAVWYLQRIASLNAWLHGEEYAIPNYKGGEDYNGKAYEARKHHTAEEHVSDWEAAHTTLIPMLESLAPEDFAATIRYPWGDSGPISLLIEKLIEHENGHNQEIIDRRKALA